MPEEDSEENESSKIKIVDENVKEKTEELREKTYSLGEKLSGLTGKGGKFSRSTKDSLDSYDIRKIAGVAGILLIGLVAVVALLSSSPKLEEDRKPEYNYTDYQESMVNCPHEYMDTCTKMSRKLTEEVFFQRVDSGNRIHLTTDRNKTMVAKLPSNTTDSYLIRIVK